MPKRNLIWILAVLAAAAITLMVTHKPVQLVQQLTGGKAVSDFDPVAETYRHITTRFLRPLESQELRRLAIESMMDRVHELDEYSCYLPPEKAQLIQERVLDGKECGIGVRLELQDGRCVVMGSLPDSPACKAGLAAGDLLLAVDGNEVKGKTLEQVQGLLRGSAGTKVHLTLRRLHAESCDEMNLARGEFDVESVQGLYRDPHGRWVYWVDPRSQIGYIRIKEFVGRTVGDLSTVLRLMQGPRGIVLDLRDNPGGLGQVACETADLFLESGAIMTELDRAGGRKVFMAHPDGTYPFVPMVVLVNDRTASAAEIVAGSLRLHDRAVLVGKRTLGKGCIQSALPLSDNMGLIYLTTAEYLVGEDQPIHRRKDSVKWGVDPHLDVELSQALQDQLRHARQRMEVIGKPEPASRPASGPSSRPAAEYPARILEEDSQLRRAMELLKSPPEMKTLLDAAALQREEDRRQRTQQEPPDKKGQGDKVSGAETGRTVNNAASGPAGKSNG